MLVVNFTIVMNAIKTVRNNWKKTVVLLGVAGWGLNFVHRKYLEHKILTAYCLQAKKYGDTLLKNGARPRKLTVFLNPAAKRGKGKDLYEKNIAPILHLAGLEVTLIKTEYEGQAKKFMDVIDPTDAILVVGGDGTLSEVITGLLRRKDEGQFATIPLGVVPVGNTNTLAKTLCPPTQSPVIHQAELAMSAVKGNTRPVNVLHIKGDEDKAVFAVSGVEWGAYTDAEMRKKGYWYFGPLKHRLTYAVTALRYWPPANNAVLSYILPCDGCNRCVTAKPKPQWRWWHVFIPPRVEVTKDFSNVINEECGQVHTQNINTAELTAVVPQHEEIKAVKLQVVDADMSRTEFIKDGWNRLKTAAAVKPPTSLAVREFTVQPRELENKDEELDAWLLIDSEKFELMNISCRLLPHKLRFYFADSFSLQFDELVPSYKH